MTEINHFSHEKHSLKLIENWVTIIGVGTDANFEKKEVVSCYGCHEPISDGSAYGCISCRHFLHETCANLMPTFNYDLHPLHSLTLIDRNNVMPWTCNVCDSPGIAGGFTYYCSLCDFDACTKCVVSIVALKKEASIKFEHKGHPQHNLTLQLRPAAFRCDACKSESKDLFYLCDNCDFWIHKTCVSLTPTIHLPHHPNHPLVLVYSLPDNFYKFRYYCEFCNIDILRNDWLYHCANCRYFAHIKCALNAAQPSTLRDGADTSVLAEECVNDFMHFPMSEAFTDPLKLLHFEKMGQNDDDTMELNHCRHDHPLILTVVSQGNNTPDIDSNDPIEVCNGCVRPLSLPYYSCSKDGCSFTLHKYCAELPRKLEHQLHPGHLLDLVTHENLYGCNGCFSEGNSFGYKCETCLFYLDVNCAFLPNTINHESHKHPLTQVMDPNPLCKACEKHFPGISYACKACNFQLDMYCAVNSPCSLAHRYCKGHQITLTYPPVEDHPEDFYCDICEKEMHPKFPLYHCHKCKNSFHLHCLSRIDWYANTFLEGTQTVSYHKHPLTFARRKRTPSYVCFGCNQDINGYLILECRIGTCPFRICFDCHVDKVK